VAELEPNERPVGTKRANYADTGPYYCGDCVHLPARESGCIHPEIIADAAVPKLANGHGDVDAKRGCCRYVRPRKKTSDAERSGMRG